MKAFRGKGIAVGVLACAASMLGVGGVWQRAAEAGNPHACFYEHVNYGGHAMCVDAGSEQLDLRRVTEADGFNWNDKISSIKILDGATALVFEHAQFHGRSFEIRSDTPDLTAFDSGGSTASFNDIITSLKVQ